MADPLADLGSIPIDSVIEAAESALAQQTVILGQLRSAVENYKASGPDEAAALERKMDALEREFEHWRSITCELAGHAAVRLGMVPIMTKGSEHGYRH